MIRLMSWLGGGIKQRMVGLTLQFASRKMVNTLLHMGGQSAVDSALGAAMEVVPFAGQQSYTQVFSVKPPLTVYVRASHCRVIVRRTTEPRVTLETSVARTFGLELAAEQDEHGIYVIARRKAVVGQVARVEFSLTVPRECHLAFNLTPGDVVLQDIDGLFELPANTPQDQPSPVSRAQ